MRPKKHNFKNLVIWQDAMDLCDKIYSYTEQLPLKERFNLTEQLCRCAVSMPSNIAEGSGKRTSVHFAEFLTTSLSSAYEAETQLLICQRRNYGDNMLLEKLLTDIIPLQSKIYNFRESILSN